MKRRACMLKTAAVLLAALSIFLCGCEELFYTTPNIVLEADKSSQSFVMPDLNGLTLDEANTLATSFKINAIEKYSADVEAGKIFEQSVKAGEEIIPASTVDVYVSKGTRLTVIPEVNGFDYQAAKNVIESQGFTVEVVYEGQEGTCDDKVNSVFPECGTEALYGSTVTIRANALEPSQIKTTITSALVRDGTRPATSKYKY